MISKISSTPDRPPGPLLEEPNISEEESEAVTSKNPRVLDTEINTTSEDSTEAEEIGSDDGTERTEDKSPQYTSPSEDSEIEYLKQTQGMGNRQERVSRSIELNTSLVKRAFGTFYMSDPNKKMIIPKLKMSSSRASRITDSNQTEENNQIKRLNKSKNQAKLRPAMSATKSNLDADSVNNANKPLTRARAKILASQNSQYFLIPKLIYVFLLLKKSF